MSGKIYTPNPNHYPLTHEKTLSQDDAEPNDNHPGEPENDKEAELRRTPRMAVVYAPPAFMRDHLNKERKKKK